MTENNRSKTNSSFKCELCDKTFSQSGTVKRHREIVHEKMKKFNCDKCDKLFTLKCNLNQHIGLVHDNREDLRRKKEYCTKCKKTIFDLKRHEMTVHEEKKQFSCQICNKAFSLAFNLKKHNSRFHEGASKNDRIQCEPCNKSFSRKDILFKHKNTIHQKSKAFKCDICGKLFNRKDKLNDHLKIHTGLIECKCKFCDKAFIHKKHLKEHISVFHSVNETKIQCEICLIEFPNLKKLQNHTKDNHSEKIEPLPTKCDICGISYLSLEDHMITHQERNTVKCVKCGKMFLSDKSLTLHNCKYQCKICDEAFSSLQLLEKHILGHKFACMICFIEFSSSVEVKNHISFHMNESNQISNEVKTKFLEETKTSDETVEQSEIFASNNFNEDEDHQNAYDQNIQYISNNFTREPSAYVCEFCDQFFAYKKVYKEHVDGHKRDESDIFVNIEPRINKYDEMSSEVPESRSNALIANKTESTIVDSKKEKSQIKSHQVHRAKSHLKAKSKKNQKKIIGPSAYVCELCDKLFETK